MSGKNEYREPEVVATEEIYRGRRVHLRKDTLRSPSGAQVVREVVVHPGAAVVVPILPGGEVLFVHQYRHPFRERLLELPAGTLEEGEDPAACARRELTEETGYGCGKLDPLTVVYPSPGVLSEVMYLYVARDLTPGPPRRDPGEEGMELVSLSPPVALAQVRRGEIRDGKTMIGLLLSFGAGG